MLRKTRVTNVFYYVTDLDQTEAFYREVLGLEVSRLEGGDEGDFLIAKTDGGLDLLFFVGETKPGNSPIVVFELVEGGIEEVVDHLVSHGSTIVTPISPAPGGVSADFTDPAGYVLSLYESREETG